MATGWYASQDTVGRLHQDADSIRSKDDRDRKDQVAGPGLADSKDKGSASDLAAVNGHASGADVPFARRGPLRGSRSHSNSPVKIRAPKHEAPLRREVDICTTTSPDAASSAGRQVPPPALAVNTADGGDRPNSNGASPTHDRPCGWVAVLYSPTQQQEQNRPAAGKAASHGPAVPDGVSDPATRPTADLSSLGPAGSPAYSNIEQQPVTTTTAASRPSSNSSSAGSNSIAASSRGSRPSPLLVPSSTGIAAAAGPPSSRLSHAASAPPADGPYVRSTILTGNRPAPVQIPMPLSPLPQELNTPTAMSPNAMARPYSGPTLVADELDLDVIDDVPSVDSLGVSASSSPIISGAAAHNIRAGGLRSSRDQHDLRRAALLNHLLSPRPGHVGSMSSIASEPAPMFTGPNRHRALDGGSASSSTCSTTSMASNMPGSGAAAADTESGSGYTPPPTTAEHLQQLLSNVWLNRANSSSTTASPRAPSILAGSNRSVPPTPAANLSAGQGGGGSRGSSATNSPVPPPTHGPAAALLAGNILPSPRTPRSPLSVVFSPRGPRPAQLQSAGSAPVPLPPPLFGPGVSNESAAAGSASPGRMGLVGRPNWPGNGGNMFRGSLLSPAGSRLGSTQLPQQPQPSEQQGSNQQQPSNTEQQEQGLSAQQQHQLPPQPLPHVLRQQLQLHDTRFGPHGESPLSPSQQRSTHHLMRGDSLSTSLLSPTRLAPLVPPTPAAAAPAAADSVAGDVGHDGVHEWLDQHSWPFSYELPQNLRDAAGVAGSSRALTALATSGVPLQRRMSLSTPGSQQQPARSHLAPSHTGVAGFGGATGRLAASRSLAAELPSAAINQITNNGSVEGVLAGHAGSQDGFGGAGSSGEPGRHTRVFDSLRFAGGVPDNVVPETQRGFGSSSAAVGFTEYDASSADAASAAGADTAAGGPVVHDFVAESVGEPEGIANARLGSQQQVRPGLSSTGRGPGFTALDSADIFTGVDGEADAAAVADAVVSPAYERYSAQLRPVPAAALVQTTGLMPAAASRWHQALLNSGGSGSWGLAGSSSERLLRPGSHRYDASMHAVQGIAGSRGIVDGISNVNSAVAAARLLMGVPPNIYVSSPAADAAAAATTSRCSSADSSATDYEPAVAAVAAATSSGRQQHVKCSNALAASKAGVGSSIGGSDAAAYGPNPYVLQLLRDKQYMSCLLASLPDVDPTCYFVQQAVAELQFMLHGGSQLPKQGMGVNRGNSVGPDAL